MDSPLSETFVLRGNFTHEFDPGERFTQFNISAYGGMVDHVMDNYTLRNAGATVMKVNSDSDTVGGKISLQGKLGKAYFTLGGDLQANNRDAVRYMGSRSAVNNNDWIQSYSWPDITLSQVGLFGEISQPVSETSLVRTGLRYDRVHFSAGKADRVAVMPGQSANQLYQQYYGTQADDRSENNVSGLLRFETSLSNNYKVFAGISRSVRTADTTERGIAQNNNTASSRWVGRPDIAPEKHHQVDIGGEASFKNWALSGSVYFDPVQDFILRDRARGQGGILLSDNASVYRNVDATLTGLEISGSYRFNEQWSMAAQSSFSYGENEEDNRPLSQIPPLTFSSSIEYAASEWMVGLRMRSAFRQPRADVETNFNSGQDVGKTGGYAVFDVYGEVLNFEPLKITVGLTNIFDTAYANHLSRSNAFDPEVVQVNEPGRSFFLRAHATF
jgi:iron complex outermembrane receptor protein